jgi:hypothetical protein
MTSPVQLLFMVHGQDVGTMRISLLAATAAFFCLANSTLLPWQASAAQLAPLQCLSTEETREEIASARLVQPLVVMRRAAGELRAEAVEGRLCRWNNELIYEISLLRRDGHIVRVLFNAADGKAVERR